MIFSSNFLKIWSFQKIWSFRVAPAHDLSCIIWKDGIFFPENMIFLHRAENERRPLPVNTWKHDASPSEEKQ